VERRVRRPPWETADGGKAGGPRRAALVWRSAAWLTRLRAWLPGIAVETVRLGRERERRAAW